MTYTVTSSGKVVPVVEQDYEDLTASYLENENRKLEMKLSTEISKVNHELDEKFFILDQITLPLNKGFARCICCGNTNPSEIQRVAHKVDTISYRKFWIFKIPHQHRWHDSCTCMKCKHEWVTDDYIK